MILVRYPDRARVLQFLQDRIEEADTSKANYYQVVGLMHAVEMGPLLRKELESLEAKLKEPPSGLASKSTISRVSTHYSCFFKRRL